MARDIGRPKKVRFIQKMPKVLQFSPRGRPGRPEEIELTLDQFETLKLADYQGFSQSEGAKSMRIARPSFGRILREARHKVADALSNGKIIKISMGDAQIGVRKRDTTKETLIEELKKLNERHKKMARDATNVAPSTSSTTGARPDIPTDKEDKLPTRPERCRPQD